MNVIDLTELGVIHVGGPDAGTFLADQMTSDVAQLTPGSGQLSAWCNPQGRVQALFRLYSAQHGYYLFTPRGLIATSLQRLQMFVMRADVTLADLSDSSYRYGFSGSGSGDSVKSLTGIDAPSPNQVATTGGVYLFGLTDNQYIVLSERPIESAHSAAIQSYDHWRLLDIQAGVPNVYVETTQQFLPQMLNLDALGGLSFAKGCYPGQEVIARLKFRGELKRRMYLASATTPDCPAAGTLLIDRDGQDSAGTVVDAQRLDGDALLLLAVLRIDAAEADRACLDGPSITALKLQPLPYALA